MTAVASARAFGNDFFKKGDHRTALKKYRKSLRYLDVCWEKGELDEGNKFLELLIALIM
jgi:peptidyl-prolyl isomerase D